MSFVWWCITTARSARRERGAGGASASAKSRFGRSRAPPTAIMAVEKTCAACNGVMLGSTLHVCGGECDKPVHSVVLCECVMAQPAGRNAGR